MGTSSLGRCGGPALRLRSPLNVAHLQRTGACPPSSASDRLRGRSHWPRLSSPASALLLAGLLAAPLPATANAMEPDLADLSLEALMDIEVTSVSKRPQKRSEAAAAIFVITADDIRRWGVNSIPDALRMVPGLHVASIDANKWAVTSRGFNSRFANKLLVLIDGRSVYTPLFAGVYWEVQDTPLTDIERIEVIRGPGGTLWGANAVNGVINIITRRAADTQGALVSLVAGQDGHDSATLRYGAELGSAGHFRVYAKQSGAGTGFNAAGGHDDWSKGQVGFRADLAPGARDKLTVQGDYYRGSAGQQVTVAIDPAPAISTFTEDVDLTGANLLLRWDRQLSDDSDFTLQAYYDHTGRDERSLYEDRDTFDLDFDHHFRIGARHDILWGAGYRRTRDITRANGSFALTPSQRSVDLWSAFLQDDIALVEDRLILTLGSKFEHNDFTGFEVQPSVRLAWTPTPAQTLWGAVSRAVRTPARGEDDVSLRVVPPNPAPGAPVFLTGSDDFESERLIAYELGYRLQVSEALSLDLAAFYNDYESLRTFDPEVFPPPALLFPFANRLQGHSHGVELAAQWQVRDNWRLQGAYSYLNMSLDRDPGSVDTTSEAAEKATPRHQASLWSSLDLGRGVELDAGVRHVGGLTAPGGAVKSYQALDVRLGWHVSDDLEVSLAGRNLLDHRHLEYVPDFIQTQSTEVERSIQAAVTWRF